MTLAAGGVQKTCDLMAVRVVSMFQYRVMRTKSAPDNKSARVSQDSP